MHRRADLAVRRRLRAHLERVTVALDARVRPDRRARASSRAPPNPSSGRWLSTRASPTSRAADVGDLLLELQRQLGNFAFNNSEDAPRARGLVTARRCPRSPSAKRRAADVGTFSIDAWIDWGPPASTVPRSGSRSVGWHHPRTRRAARRSWTIAWLLQLRRRPATCFRALVGEDGPFDAAILHVKYAIGLDASWWLRYYC